MKSTSFCHDCYLHFNRANAIYSACARSGCKADQFEQIGLHFTELASAASSSRMQVLASYAKAMAGFARNLINKSESQPGDSDISLLKCGIEIGLPCQEGQKLDQCPNQNFDVVWPLIAELRAHTSEHVLSLRNAK